MIKVLVVDDDKLVRKGLISAMPWRDVDMEVVGEASNGDKALEFLENHPVDLLLTDLAMPVMSGIDLMRIVRKRYPSIHIVVLTFHQDFEYVQEALRLGAIDYIAKVQLEKERFDEVLQRVADQIRLREGSPPQISSGSPDTIKSDSGYAFLSLKSGSHSGTLESIRTSLKGALIEVGLQLWLWLPSEEIVVDQEEQELWTESFRPEEGWGMVYLQGLYGLSMQELQANLLKYKERDFFYDFDYSGETYSLTLGIDETKLSDYTEEGLTLLKAQWSSHEWIYEDGLYEILLQQLKMIRLPQAKLIGFLYSMTDVWNRWIELIGLKRMVLDSSLDYWVEVESVLSGIRQTIRSSMEKMSFSQEVIDAIMKAVALVLMELDQQVTAADVAKRVNMSRSYFSLCFKEIVGKTFNEYVRHARMEKAKELLLYTNKTIAVIAENTGYTDEKYFSRTFREHIGILPSEFRSTKPRR